MSLTPHSRNQEAADDAAYEGAVNGLLTLAPCTGLLYVAMQRSPRFVKATNWQSRTALVIMPALFVFGLTAEQRLEHKMKQIAQETQHSRATIEWAEQERSRVVESSKQAPQTEILDTESHLTQLYQQSVKDSGVSIVPGDKLGPHHVMANYVAANPVKTLASLAVPAVAYIFYGRAGQQHLQLQSKLMHTRVFGQFAVVSLLLGVIGFKEYMDQNGRFITQAEADARVQEMKQVRAALMARLDEANQHQLEMKQEIAKAHEEVVAEWHKKHDKKKSVSKAVDASSIPVFMEEHKH